MNTTKEGFAHPEFLIETGALAARLGDPDLVVLDSTTHLIPDPKITYTVKSGREDFEKGHIPGAQFVDLQADLSDNSGRYGKLRFMLPNAGDFAEAMGRFGVGEKSRVVIYSTTAPQWAARVWWMLRNYGFDSAAVLNGGFQKWAREGRPVETGPGRARPPVKFVVREDRKLMVGKEAVKGAIGDAQTCTINALSREQHAGSRRQCLRPHRAHRAERQRARRRAARPGDRTPSCRPRRCGRNSRRSAPSTSRASSPIAAAALPRAPTRWC